MPHIPPRITSFEGEENDGTWLYQAKESVEIVIPPPSLPEKSRSRKSITDPTPAPYQHHQRYLSSLSEASSASADSNGNSDDDETSAILITSTLEDRAKTKECLNLEVKTEDEYETGDEGFDNDGFEDLEPYQETILAHENHRGSIAVVIRYILVGKPKIVDIPESPRSSDERQRRSIESKSSISPTSSISQTFGRWKDVIDRKLSGSPPTPNLSEVTTPVDEVPSPFVGEEAPTTTTICYADNPLKEDNASTWHGLVRSLSTAKRKASPRKGLFEAKGRLGSVASFEDEPPRKLQRRPLGLVLNRSKASKLQAGPQTPITA